MIRNIIITLTMFFTLFTVVYFQKYNVENFTCVGTFKNDIQINESSILNAGNISLSIFNGKKIRANIDASLTVNEDRLHLGRDLIFDVEAVDNKTGLYRITYAGGHSNMSDTVATNEILSQIFGTDDNGRLIRMRRLNGDTLLIGNPYTPVYSCVAIHP